MSIHESIITQISKIRAKWNEGSDRSRLIIKNVILSSIMRVLGVLLSLIIIPLTIDYLDATKYGIWLTISTLVSWLHFFDMGLTNGFRNKFAEAIAVNNVKLAKEYVSTTYFILFMIIGLVLFLVTIVNPFINWSSILNIAESYNDELQEVFLILSVITCVGFVADVFTKLVIADQRPAYSSLFVLVGQALSLLAIFLLKEFAEPSLVSLAILYSSIPCLVIIISSIVMFTRSKYKIYRPSVYSINLKLSKNIVNIGVKFFLIQICLLIIIQLSNIIISRNCGPLAVTEFNVAYKYYSMLLIVTTILIGPMWSAFTDAYTKQDFKWMKNIIHKFDIYSIIITVIGIIFLLCYKFVFRLWIGSSVSVAFMLSLLTMIYALIQTMGYMYMTLVNGIGTLRIQVIIFVIFAAISYPTMNWCCMKFGVSGITVIPIIVYLAQAIFLRIQVKKIVSGTATGIWLKE